MSREKYVLLIVGGCFPVQSNIEKENLYHQLIKKKVEEKLNVSLEVRTVRYERFTGCLDKIKQQTEAGQVDAILFHVRSEPFLRLSKLYYRYLSDNRYYTTFNLPFKKVLPAERHEFTLNHPMSWRTDRKGPAHYALRELNYIFGGSLGNAQRAAEIYKGLVNKIHYYCKLKKISLIVQGPVPRPHTIMENFLSGFLENSMAREFASSQVMYLSCWEIFSGHQELFFRNGIHVSPEGHRKVAELLFPSLSQKILNKNTLLHLK
jgi:hypothetical protein